MATTFEVSRDVTLDGHPIRAGTYSVWMIPRQSGEWTVVLDPDFRRYHAEPPDSTPNQVRFPTHAEAGPFTEVLTWAVPALAGTDRATVTMQWFSTRVALELKVQPSLAAQMSAEDAAAFVGRYDVTCARPSDELCRHESGNPGQPIPLILSHEMGRLIATYDVKSGQPEPFALVRIAPHTFVFGWCCPRTPRDLFVEEKEWMVFEFQLEGVRATGFDVRNYRNELLATGKREH
jgi:hypothetical protein